MTRGSARSSAVVLGSVVVAIALACAGARVAPAPLRISELVQAGDHARRASLRLIQRGLEADAAREYRQSLGYYERAIQVDPGNPYAYLALARSYVEREEPARAFEALDQAEFLLESQGERSARVEPHLLGLRGAADRDAGNASDAALLLARAQQLAPSVWGDGRLTADELR